MEILLSGSSGLLGSALLPSLRSDGHRIRRLVRGTSAPSGDVAWNPATFEADAAGLAGVEAVIHLAGANIASGRWTRARKAAIRDSRVLGTRGLVRSLRAMSRPPRVLLSASAVGWYGDRGDAELTESEPAATDFLGRVCQDWEAEAAALTAEGTRVTALRSGVILAAEGGALPKMLTPFRLGLGGRLGHGRQWMSWISLPDAVAAIRFLLGDRAPAGPVNLVGPAPVTNAAFTSALARALRRPAILPMPAALARLAFGEVADALLLASTRAIPARLEASGFRSAHPGIDEALRVVLSRR